MELKNLAFSEKAVTFSLTGGLNPHRHATERCIAGQPVYSAVICYIVDADTGMPGRLPFTLPAHAPAVRMLTTPGIMSLLSSAFIRMAPVVETTSHLLPFLSVIPLFGHHPDE